VLWVIAQDFVMRYRPQRRISYALWATAQDLVMRFGPQDITSYQSADPHTFFDKLTKFFKGTMRLKSEYLLTVLP
jgi:hypothetical protein